MADLFKSIRAGLTQPSLLALAVCFGVLCVDVGLYFAFANPEHLRAGWIGSGDDSAWATFLHHHPKDANLAIIGASGTRESMDQKTLAKDLGVAPLLLATSAQVSFDSAALAAELPASVSTVIIGITPSRVLHEMERVERTFRQPSFGFISPYEDAEYGTALGWKRSGTGLVAADRRAFYLLLLREYPFALLRGRLGKRTEHAYRNKPQRKNIEIDFPARMGLLDQMSPIHLGVFDRLIDHLRSQGKQVVLLQGPACRTWFGTPQEQQFYAKYDALMTKFTSDKQIPLWDLDDEAGLTCDNFMDLVHLRHADAQEAYSHVLAAKIRSLGGDQ